jgi:hypothetical protein
MTDAFDVFISYAHADADWVRVLAENLHQQGLQVFFDEWEIGPGDVLVHRLDKGILNSRNGILVVSPDSLSRPWVAEEYAAMITRAVAAKQRLIPVLLKDAELPPLLASRVYIDFRQVDGPLYDQRLKELVAALKGERRGPPPRTGELQPPPGTGFRAEGALRYRLRITPQEVTLVNGGKPVQHRPRGLDHAAEQRLWELERARRRGGSADTHLHRAATSPNTGMEEAPLHSCSLSVGAALNQAFLGGPVSQALAAAAAEAERLNVSLTLGIETDEQLAILPWETLRLPGSPDGLGIPLALHPRINLYRAITDLGTTPAISIPGPLRILVAIGSPEAQNARGELLDMEKELALILDAVEPTRKQGKALVRILEIGGVTAMREALSAQRYHVLHISCHAGPGVLILEDAEGREDRVDTGRLWREGLVPNRGVPLVVLAGCATALPGEEKTLPSLARALLNHGVPAVVAMQASVSDPYASELCACLYAALATHADNDPLTAFCKARRVVEEKRRNTPETALRQQLAEWATPTLYLRGTVQPLYDLQAPFEPVELPPEPRLAPGIVIRQVGDFVGRRREQRLLLRALRDKDSAGVLLHGIGGVGKSTLAAHALQRLSAEGWLLVSVFGRQSAGSLLEAIGTRLFGQCLAEGRDEKDPVRQIAVFLKQPNEKWEDRYALLSSHILGQRPLLLLLDNFEDNLDGAHALNEPDLAEMLSYWLQDPGQSRILITCRYRFSLPNEAQERLEVLPLGPLSLAETRKLVWRLPGLDALPAQELERAYQEVGGHPRALEYLDALLRGGQARFRDIEQRLKKALQQRGIHDPSRWCRNIKGQLEQALAETVTLATDDVLLDALLARLSPVPLAWPLLLGTSVYRRPVDEIALYWQVGEERPVSLTPEQEQQLQRLMQSFAELREQGQEITPENLNLPAEEIQQALEVYASVQKPPIRVPEGIEEASMLLEELVV